MIICSLVHAFIDCGGAPFLPLLFIVVNMAFNISLLNLVKMSSALVASLTATSAGPPFFLLVLHAFPLLHFHCPFWRDASG
jgi:hypothetical protein